MARAALVGGHPVVGAGGLDTVAGVELGFAVPVSGSWATPANVAEIAERAETLGYASLWTFQRLLSPLDDGAPVLAPPYRSVHDPLALLAFLAGRTTTARLGVAIVNMPYYPPLVLAKMLTTIDHLSDGRLDAGLGIGWLPPEMAAAGVPMARRGARADDYLACLRAIWTDDVVEYSGEFYEVPRSRVDPKPVQRPHPPILLGGAAEPALRRIGRVAAGWISASRHDLTRIDEAIATVKGAAVAAGRDAEELRFVCRGVVKVRDDERSPLTGSLDDIRADLDDLAAKGVTETFVDLNFDPEIGSPDADPASSMRRAHEVLDALAPA
jgi:probable F420-dependent oxidoreductase